MRNSRGSCVVAALAIATLVTVGGLAGCGGGGDGRDRGAVTVKADAVDVTYYYLPG